MKNKNDAETRGDELNTDEKKPAPRKKRLFTFEKKKKSGGTLEPSGRRSEQSELPGNPIDLEQPEEKPRINKRYRRAALIVRACKFTALTAFLVFFLGMVVVFSEEITIENFRYVIKDLNLQMPATVDEFGQMYYVASTEQQFALYRGDLITAGCEQLEITDVSGGKVQTAQLNYLKPRLEVSDKYALVYDLSGMNFSVYNSFSCIYKETMSYPISCAKISDGGSFLIATRDDEYISVVYYYGKTTERLYKWCSNDKYIVDMLLCEDGTFYLTVVYTTDGFFTSEVIKCNYSSEKFESVAVVEDCCALGADFISSDSYAVLCTDRILFFGDKGLDSVYSFEAGSCNKFSVGGGFCAALISSAQTGSEPTLMIFDASGAAVTQAQVPSGALILRCEKGSAYLVYDGEIIRAVISNETLYKCETDHDVLDVLQLDDDVLLLATQTRAYPVSITYDFAAYEK